MHTHNLTFEQVRNRLVSGVCKRARIMPGQHIKGTHSMHCALNTFHFDGATIIRKYANQSYGEVPARDCIYKLEIIE